MSETQDQIAALRRQLAEAEAEAAASPTEQPESVPETATTATSSPDVDVVTGATSNPEPEGSEVPASVPAEPPANNEPPTQGEAPNTVPEPAEPQSVAADVVEDAEPVVVSALDGLAKEKQANPQASFAEHLRALADKGLAAAVNPADESAVLRAVVQLLKEVIA